MMLRAIEVGHLAPVVLADQAAPQLAWLAIADLVVDETYQRAITPAGWRAIQRIADHFSWQRFGPVLVAPLAGGKFGIVDGQHRVHAAALCGILQVPAMIVPMTAQDQAKAFSWVNGAVLRVTPHAMLKAAIAGGDPVAVAAKAAIEAAGCVWAMGNPSGKDRRPATVYAPGWPRKMVERGLDQAMTRALVAMRDFDKAGRVALWSDYVMVPWVMAVSQAPAGADLPGVLRRVEPFKVVEAAERSLLPGSAVSKAAKAWGAMLADSAQVAA
jgi:hypothetical protein